MITYPDNFTVAEIKAFEAANPQLPQILRRQSIQNYDDFIKLLYEELENQIIPSLEQDANTLNHPTENFLNADICRQFNRLGYDARHDQNNRGHADIRVSLKTWTWIGEGKKVHSVNNSYLMKGYDQLCERYLTGTDNELSGGMLIYCFAERSTHVSEQWKNALIEQNNTTTKYAYDIVKCNANPSLNFYSSRTHQGTGNKMTIKHLFLSLYWNFPKA